MYSLDEKINSRVNVLSIMFKDNFCNCKHNTYLKVRLTLIPNNKIKYPYFYQNRIEKIVNYYLKKYYKRSKKYNPSLLYIF